MRASANGRYLINAYGIPVFLAGDCPQALVVNVSLADAETYIASRAADGCNALWFHVLVKDNLGGRADGSTYDGILPFTTPGDLSTPNPAYFARVDAMIRLAARYGLLVLLDPIETSGHLAMLTADTQAHRQAYGAFLATAYKDVPNLIWLFGNDFQTWRTVSDDNALLDVANAVASGDSNHLITVELDYNSSDSRQDTRWDSILTLNTDYCYYPVYYRTKVAYQRVPAIPVYFIEGNYEYQAYGPGYGAGPFMLRGQEWWSYLAGGLGGHIYGNANIFAFPVGWQTNGYATSPGWLQFKIYANFLESLGDWWNCVSDFSQSVCTAGYGTYDDTDDSWGYSSDYAMCGYWADGSKVLVYTPVDHTLTIAMTTLRGTVTARWFDPTNGNYTDIGTYANTGTRNFTSPGLNAGGANRDWILVLTA